MFTSFVCESRKVNLAALRGDHSEAEVTDADAPIATWRPGCRPADEISEEERPQMSQCVRMHSSP